MNDHLKPVASSLESLCIVTDNCPWCPTSGDKFLQCVFQSSANIDLDNFKCTAAIVAQASTTIYPFIS